MGLMFYIIVIGGILLFTGLIVWAYHLGYNEGREQFKKDIKEVHEEM